MIRVPYFARVTAGIIVTLLEESRKLPTTAVTLPMSAVSQTLQAAMRLQQNVAELAIKGDEVLDGIFHKDEEQPSWATFDDDNDDDDFTPVARPNFVQKTTEPAATKPTPPATPKTPTKTTAKKAPAKKVAAKKTPAKTNSSTAAATAETSGRFALYSEPVSITEPKAVVTPSNAPEIVEYLDYETLSLAQLRTKIRTISLEELEELVRYEKSNRSRAPYLTLLENRVLAAAK